MLDKKAPKRGRKNTRAKRLLQSETVMDIVKARFETAPGGSPLVVLGDLNDHLAADQGTTSGIGVPPSSVPYPRLLSRFNHLWQPQDTGLTGTRNKLLAFALM
jgi:hypothetical protein